MEFRLQRIALMLFFSASAFAQSEPEQNATTSTAPTQPPLGVMRKALLQDSKPYEVAVGSVPTTILLPDVPDAFESNNITTQPNTAAPVFLQHTPGTKFFSVKSVLPGVADLNVIIKNSIYSFRFFYSENPVRALTISPAPPAASIRKNSSVNISARRLYDIMQDAKTYFVVKEHHPELERTIQVAAPGKVMEYPGYKVIIDQIFRFDRDDTLVLRVIFLNDETHELSYHTPQVGLRAGRNIYWPSFAQLPGVIPPRSDARITWEVSPDITELTITSPEGKSADITDRSALTLPMLGSYLITAKDAKGRSDSVKFVAEYPAPAAQPSPLIMSKSETEFGIRKLTVNQPEAGQNFGYVCFTGTADGQRANLSVENDFTLIVPVTRPKK